MRHSQASQILAALSAADGQWVSAYLLHELSGSLCVHSRIADLRKQGHAIENRTGRVGERTFSEYRLLAKAHVCPLVPPILPRIEKENQFALIAEERPLWPD